MHAAAPVSEYFPDSQSAHAEMLEAAGVVENFPEEQSVHMDELVALVALE